MGRKARPIDRVKSLMAHIPDELYLHLYYFMRFKRWGAFKNPKLFSEKMQWTKLHLREQRLVDMVDKYAAKEYVAKKIGPQYITPTIGVWDRFEDIDFDRLPEKFVIKCTHDSGGLVVCNDRSKLDLADAKAKIDLALSRDYWLNAREWPYSKVPRRIIAEEYLENDPKEGLHDYKIWCFNGEPTYVQYITGRIAEQTYEAFYDFKWNRQSFTYHNPGMEGNIEKLKNLDELYRVAKVLCADLPFARVDFYILEDGSIRFGEVTLFPMGGLGGWHPDEMDRILGEKIILPTKK